MKFITEIYGSLTAIALKQVISLGTESFMSHESVILNCPSSIITFGTLCYAILVAFGTLHYAVAQPPFTISKIGLSGLQMTWEVNFFTSGDLRN